MYTSFQSLTFVLSFDDAWKSSTENICIFTNYMEIFGSWLAAAFAAVNEHPSILTCEIVEGSKISHKTRRFTSTAFIFPPYLTLCILKWQQFPHRNIDFPINMSSVFDLFPTNTKVLSTNWNWDDTFECDVKWIENH